MEFLKNWKAIALIVALVLVAALVWILVTSKPAAAAPPPATSSSGKATTGDASNSLVGKTLTRQQQEDLLATTIQKVEYASQYAQWRAANWEKVKDFDDAVTRYGVAVRNKAKQILVDQGYLISI